MIGSRDGEEKDNRANMRTQSGLEQAIGLDRDQLVEAVREALNHLYDPGRLRNSALVPLLGLEGRLDSAVQLRSALVDAIEAIEPQKTEPAGSPAWQTYEILYYRYVQRLSQAELAEQIGVGERHIRRKQHAAVETLADVIWSKVDRESSIVPATAIVDERPAVEAKPGPETGSGDVEDELAWVEASINSGPANLNEVLPALLDLVGPLAERHHTRLVAAIERDLPKAAIGEMALRQVLLCLLTTAISRLPNVVVRLDATYRAREAAIRIETSCRAAYPPGGAASIQQSSVELAYRLARLCGSHLDIESSAEAFFAALAVPVLEATPVLAIDDNPDTLQLLERYTTGSRYRLIATPDPEQALSLARRVRPRAIVLDVMMPKVDGWEMLGRLREDQVAGGIPIVVSTILPQKDLATALGADAFLRKPVTREAFLSTLNGLVQASG